MKLNIYQKIYCRVVLYYQQRDFLDTAIGRSFFVFTFFQWANIELMAAVMRTIADIHINRETIYIFYIFPLAFNYYFLFRKLEIILKSYDSLTNKQKSFSSKVAQAYVILSIIGLFATPSF